MKVHHFGSPAVWVFAWLVASGVAFAHGDLHERIAELTKRIAAEPRDARLYAQRAKLQRQHEGWQAALADCDQAQQLDPAVEVDHLRGLTLLESGHPEEAVPAFDRVLGRRPDDAQALLGRARALARLGRQVAAAADYTSAIGQMAEPQPEYYLERAQAMVASGQDPLGGLDEGIAKLGPIVTLELAAIRFELERGNYDGALRRVAQQAEQSERKESWLARRGDILAQAGRAAEARAAYADAWKAVQMLPERLRQAESMQRLSSHLRAVSDPLSAESASASPP